jgi:hypothetical protein
MENKTPELEQEPKGLGTARPAAGPLSHGRTATGRQSVRPAMLPFFATRGAQTAHSLFSCVVTMNTTCGSMQPEGTSLKTQTAASSTSHRGSLSLTQSAPLCVWTYINNATYSV